jgi:hypothetical protein
MMIKRIYCII